VQYVSARLSACFGKKGGACVYMSRYYPPEFLQELKMKANLVDIASQYTEVRRIGQNYLAKCLFHDDHRPSMQIKPETNTFYCHACGAGSANHSLVKSSDVISFVRHVNRFTFSQAVEYLASWTNTPLPAIDPQEQQKQYRYQQWVSLCEQAANEFHEQIKTNEKALSYLSSRGFTHLEIEIWKLGYAAEIPHEIFSNLKNRIIFPIYDFQGNIIGFAGRVPFSKEVLETLNQERKREGKHEIVKYVNLKNTEHFVKGHHLYGIHIARDYIRQWRTAILTEGYTDVISLHRSGAQHTVSTMGIALTEHQARLLKQAGAEKVILMRDADEAGLIASERDAKVLEKVGLQTFIVPLPEGMDPDDLCWHYGLWNEGLSKYIHKHMQSIEQWKINRIYKQTQDEILYHYTMINHFQSDRLQKVIEVLATIDDPIQLDMFIRQVSELFVVSYDAIKEKLNHYKAKNKQSQNKVVPFHRKVV
jgi:DNA primase